MTLRELAIVLEKNRREKMLSVNEFSVILGISPPTYKRIIEGKANKLRANTLRKFQKELQIHPKQLFELMR